MLTYLVKVNKNVTEICVLFLLTFWVTYDILYLLIAKYGNIKEVIQ